MTQHLNGDDVKISPKGATISHLWQGERGSFENRGFPSIGKTEKLLLIKKKKKKSYGDVGEESPPPLPPPPSSSSSSPSPSPSPSSLTLRYGNFQIYIEVERIS